MFDELKKIFEEFNEYFDDLRDTIKIQMKRFDEAFKKQKKELEDFAEMYPDKVKHSEIKVLWNSNMDEPEITTKGDIDEKVIENIKKKFSQVIGRELFRNELINRNKKDK